MDHQKIFSKKRKSLGCNNELMTSLSRYYEITRKFSRRNESHQVITCSRREGGHRCRQGVNQTNRPTPVAAPGEGVYPPPRFFICSMKIHMDLPFRRPWPPPPPKNSCPEHPPPPEEFLDPPLHSLRHSLSHSLTPSPFAFSSRSSIL